jgi:hypothetical protein
LPNFANDERMHHYQRGRASITGLTVELREIIETGRLVVVVMTRLVEQSRKAAIPSWKLLERYGVELWW